MVLTSPEAVVITALIQAIEQGIEALASGSSSTAAVQAQLETALAANKAELARIQALPASKPAASAPSVPA